MAESAREWHERVSAAIEADGHRAVRWSGFGTWPFDGEPPATRPLRPLADEAPRVGTAEADDDCRLCGAGLPGPPPEPVVWRDELWVLQAAYEPTPLPLRCFLMPRRHADLADLTPAGAARCGELFTAIERAAVDVLDIQRTHVARWGDGAAHLHWHVFARPTGVTQLRGPLVTLWEELLPTRDQAATRADLDEVAARLTELTGGETFPAPRA